VEICLHSLIRIHYLLLVRAERLQAGYLPDSNYVSTEVEESPTLETVARERLVKTQQAGKGLTCAAVICELW
jgi:hypothetical protein